MPTIDRTIGSYHDSSNARIRKIGLWTGPTSYATGGEVLVATDLGMGKIELLQFEDAHDGSVLRRVRLVVTTVAGVLTYRVKWFDYAGVELAGATNLTTFSARFEAIGY